MAGLSCPPPAQGAKWRYRERAGEKIKREGEKKRKGGRMEEHIQQSVYVEVPRELLGVSSFYHVGHRNQTGSQTWQQALLPPGPFH